MLRLCGNAVEHNLKFDLLISHMFLAFSTCIAQRHRLVYLYCRVNLLLYLEVVTLQFLHVFSL